MRILYLSCHGVLEFDEVKLLTELGHDVFCHGDIKGNERPNITGREDRCNWMSPGEIQEVRKQGQEDIPEFLIERCDAVVCMHVSQWLQKQWARLRGKRCFLRLIGQHFSGLGTALKPMTDDGLRILTYWETDNELNGLHPDQGKDLVRFYKDETEFCGWLGEDDMVMTACNDIMRGSGQACHAEVYSYVTSGLPRILAGRGNRLFGDFTARVPYWLLKELYRRCRIYFYLGTEPATYTLNLIEAMMTGMPIVAYDSGKPIESLVSFSSDDQDELRETLQSALDGNLVLKPMREKAVEVFGKQQALGAWKAVLS